MLIVLSFIRPANSPHYIKFIQNIHYIQNFDLIFWCGNFVEVHSFRTVSGKSPEALRNLCLCTKFLHQEIGESFVFYVVSGITSPGAIRKLSRCTSFKWKTISKAFFIRKITSFLEKY